MDETIFLQNLVCFMEYKPHLENIQVEACVKILRTDINVSNE